MMVAGTFCHVLGQLCKVELVMSDSLQQCPFQHGCQCVSGGSTSCGVDFLPLDISSQPVNSCLYLQFGDPNRQNKTNVRGLYLTDGSSKTVPHAVYNTIAFLFMNTYV